MDRCQCRVNALTYPQCDINTLTHIDVVSMHWLALMFASLCRDVALRPSQCIRSMWGQCALNVHWPCQCTIPKRWLSSPFGPNADVHVWALAPAGLRENLVRFYRTVVELNAYQVLNKTTSFFWPVTLARVTLVGYRDSNSAHGWLPLVLYSVLDIGAMTL